MLFFSNMPVIDRALFGGEGELLPGVAALLEIGDYEDSVTNTLATFNWNGKPVGCISLELSEDNTRVEGGCFLVRGPLDTRDVKIKANTIWNANGDIMLTVKIPDGSSFSFEDGSLCSEYLASDEVSHCFSKPDEGAAANSLLPGELEELGIGKFCLRLLCHLTRATPRGGVVLHFTVLIYPGSKDEIMAISELAQSASWPGLLLTEGDLSLFPLPSTAWQCPVLPLLYTGTGWEPDNIILPPSNELRRAIASIMVRSTPPEVYKTRAGIIRNWEKYSNTPEEFNPKRSPVTWPAPEPAQPTTGRPCSLCNSSLIICCLNSDITN